jgi:hypothetical protein
VSFAEFRTKLLKVCDTNGWKFVEYNDGFKVEVTIRKVARSVVVTFVDDPDTGEVFSRFASLICQANILDHEFCLRLNGENRFLSGFVALRKDRLVFLDSQLVSEADELEIKLKIRNAAKFSLALSRLAKEASEGRGTGKFVRRRITATMPAKDHDSTESSSSAGDE